MDAEALAMARLIKRAAWLILKLRSSIFIAHLIGSSQAVLHCAHRATTASSWGLCEQEGRPGCSLSHFFLSRAELAIPLGADQNGENQQALFIPQSIHHWLPGGPASGQQAGHDCRREGERDGFDEHRGGKRQLDGPAK